MAQTIGERNGSRPNWADLADSSCEDMLDSQPKRQRISWNDLCDSSREDLENQPPPPAFLNTDSYIETPEPSFDHAYGSVIRNMKAATDLNNERLSAALQNIHNTSHWRPSVSAPAFVSVMPIPASAFPAWTPAPAPSLAPASTIISIDPEPASSSAANVDAAAASSMTEQRPSPDADSNDRPRHRRARRGAFASRHVARSGSKRLRQDETTPSASLEVGAELTEEDWQRRHEKRVNVVTSIKTTAEYQAMSEMRARGRPAPSTPNPHDRAVSKRKWESLVSQWRCDLKTY